MTIPASSSAACPTLLVPSRDIGYQISGDIVKRRVSYTVGVFNGVPDNGLSDASVERPPRLCRAYFPDAVSAGRREPVERSGIRNRRYRAAVIDGIALPAYKTFGQNTFFTFASGVTAAGHRTRLAPQAYYYLGPFGLLAEYTLAEEGLQKGTVRRDIAFRAWQVEASYIPDRRKQELRHSDPRKPFDPAQSRLGRGRTRGSRRAISAPSKGFSTTASRTAATITAPRARVGGRRELVSQPRWSEFRSITATRTSAAERRSRGREPSDGTRASATFPDQFLRNRKS